MKKKMKFIDYKSRVISNPTRNSVEFDLGREENRNEINLIANPNKWQNFQILEFK